jgi:hypothetical protein
MILSITMIRDYAECNYAQGLVLFIIMLSVIMLNVVMLSVVMLNVIMLSVVMLNVIKLSVVAPTKSAKTMFLEISLYKHCAKICRQ